MGGHSSKLGLNSHNMEGTLDDLEIYALWMWVALLGLWGVVSYAPILMCRQYATEKFTPTMYGLNQLSSLMETQNMQPSSRSYRHFRVNLIEQSSLDTVMISPQDIWNGNPSR